MMSRRLRTAAGITTSALVWTSTASASASGVPQVGVATTNAALTLTLTTASLIGTGGSASIAIAAKSGLARPTEAKPFGLTPAPPGQSYVALPITVTNAGTQAIPIETLISDFWGGPNVTAGNFNIPANSYRTTLGMTDDGGANQQFPFPNNSCELSDISVPGDCEISFFLSGGTIDYTAGYAQLYPNESVQLEFITDTPYPNALDLSQARVFVRDPNDASYSNPHKFAPCGDPANPQFGYACEPPLTRELLFPGSRPVPTPHPTPPAPSQLLPPCSLLSSDSEGTSSITFYSLTAGSITSLENSFRSDGKHWIVSRSHQFAGLRFGLGAHIGPVATDIDVSGVLTFGTAYAATTTDPAAADTLSRYFGGKLTGPSADSARNLAIQDLEQTSADSGVDLEGGVQTPGSGGSIQLSHAAQTVRDRGGDKESVSILTLAGSFLSQSGSFIGLGGGANVSQTSDFVVDDQNRPVRLEVDTSFGLDVNDFGVSRSISAADLLSKLAKDASATVNATSTTGFVVTVTQVLDLQQEPSAQVGQRLLAALEGSNTDPNLDKEVDRTAETSVVVSSETTTMGGLSVSAGDVVVDGVDLSTSQTDRQVVFAVRRDPGGAYTPWTDCTPPAG
jgi:hypothetical protein